MVTVSLPSPAQVGAVGAAATLAAGVGISAQRLVLARLRQDDDPYRNEDFGGLRGRPGVVVADDGVELYVEVDEVDAAQIDSDVTVVFCHGYALNMDAWHFQRKALRGTARLVFADQRSHGRSGRAPSSSISMDRLGRDLRQIVEAVAPGGPVVLVGHSMGGMSVMAFADQYPDLVGDLVAGFGLIATSAGGLDQVALGVRGALARRLHRFGGTASVALSKQPVLVDYARRRPSDLAYLATRHYSFDSPVPDSIVDFTTALNVGSSIEVIRDFLPIFAEHDRMRALPTIGRVPTLIMAAEGDYLTPVDHGRAMAGAIPDADYVEVANAGHMMMLEYPELVSLHVAGLVDRARAQA